MSLDRYNTNLHIMKLLKLTFLAFLIIASSLTSPSSAAGRGFVHQTDITEEQVHERLLRVNTRDYGRYDPSPTFVKPPFKLIPN
uniref:Uncharacterized protein n=1 Tax=Kalanchoe fedtschenkoi TaxID=63787 RepID=A0A7N0T1S6_KALFE